MAEILSQIAASTGIGGQDPSFTIPFSCLRYRANVRVVDFSPKKLEDFSHGKRKSEYDILSDYGSDSDSSEEDASTLDYIVGERVWKWGFSLRLEDAAAASNGCDPRPTFWAYVDNSSAQLLTGLDARE